MSGSKKGKSKTLITTYFMSIHYGICAGPIDKLFRLIYGEKLMWSGPIAEEATLHIENRELFGGYKKEGGVAGVCHYLPGAEDQEAPAVLASRYELTVATCPGFRGIASLLFIRGQNAPRGGFYWTANSPYLRPVWAEIQNIEHHDNSYEWYPSKAKILRPGSIEMDTARLGNDVSASKILITGVTGNAPYKWDTNGDFAVRGENNSISSTWQIWTLPSGTQRDVTNNTVPGAGGEQSVHIADTGDIITHTLAQHNLHIWSPATGELRQIVALDDLGLSIVSVFMDDYTVEINETTGEGTTYLLMWKNYHISTRRLILLKLNGLDWEKVWEISTSGDVQSLSMGPTYGYCMAGLGPITQILRIPWTTAGGAEGTLVTPPGLTAAIAACYYDEESDNVVIACINGDLFVYSADLTELITSRTGNGFTLSVDGLLSKRMSSGAGRIAFRSGGSIYEFAVPSLAPLRTLVESEQSSFWPGTGEEHRYQGYNKKWSALFLPTHFGNTRLWFLGGSARYDMNPAHIILESLVNTRWGMGHPMSGLDLTSFVSAADTLYTENFGLSLMWTRQGTIEKFINEILDHIEATLYVNPQTGLLTLKLIRDDYNVDTLPIYDEDNCTVIEFQRKSMADIINEVVVSWTDPENEDKKTVTRHDLAGISAQGGIVSDSRDYYGVRYADLAAKLADRDLRAGSYPLATAIVEADRTGWDLVPGGVIKLRDPEHGIGIIVMRILAVDYGRPGEPRVRLELVEDIFALDQATFVEPPGGSWEEPGELPSAMAQSQVFTLPYFMLVLAGADAGLEYPEAYAGILAAQSGEDTFVYDLYGETTDAAGGGALEFLGTNNVLARATLSSALTAAAQSSLVLDDLTGLTEGEGAVAGGFALIGDGDEEEDELCLITAVSSGVATLQRGILDTTPKTWPVGTPIWFFSSNERLYDPLTRSAAETVRYKLLSRTSRGLLDLASAPIISYVLSDRAHLPTRPANVKVEGVGFGAIDLSNHSPPYTEFDVTWARRNRLTEDSQPLAWTAAGVTPESGQRAKVSILDADTREVLKTYENLTGELQTVPLSDFQTGISPIPTAVIVRVTATNSSDSPPSESLQGHEITVIVDPGVDGLQISGTPVTTGQEDIAYAGFTVTASGGAPPYTFSLIGDWPAGIELGVTNGATVSISGTPTESGTFTGLSVRVTDSLGDTADLPTFTLTISAADTTAPILTNPAGGDVP